MQVPAFYSDPAWRLEFRRGVRAALPAAPGVVAWALVMGVATVKSGLAVPGRCSFRYWFMQVRRSSQRYR